ncbi:MAG: hypothetical protein M1827_000325 [Pycnora praestabilis]|nr:MAG: hypothetical protein M1827_000325 [Pycnora praestabilis]
MAPLQRIHFLTITLLLLLPSIIALNPLPHIETPTLTKRARFAGFNAQGVANTRGPPNPNTVCDLRLYGRARSSDCLDAGMVMASTWGNWNPNANFDNVLLSRSVISVREFVNIGTEDWWQQGFRDTVDLPQNWASGQANHLILYAYNINSPFADEQDTESECSDTPQNVATRLRCDQSRRRFRPDSDSDAADDSEDAVRVVQRLRTRACGAGAWSFYTDDQSCCDQTGYDWTEVGVVSASTLFGSEKISSIGDMGICVATNP